MDSPAVTLSAGNYIIYNRVLSPRGEKLALTYPGRQRTPVTVSPLDGSSEQAWILRSYDSNSNTWTISPVGSPNSQIGWGAGNVPVVLPPNNYVWTLTLTSGGYNIQDGKRTVSWSLNNATAGEEVSIGADATFSGRWVIEKV
ncbi:hypothetical protein CC2G_003530 [Coprinopsis cinerea AmutBmut pab1-1]|uniref:CCL2 lectin n=1 Tax=Coprinopsis cinerea TaxID=5346 RepID=B3GA02_COPCI|nr:CCL2 lectin [Coprinopsis cinerea]KAG2005032.1 hypothetical protein CC2G_003530 [Coprinopsis cinerea AmutBmut pab1-1]